MAGLVERTEEIAAALKPFCEMLAADGYEMTVRPGQASVVLDVQAGPDACAECLVPKSLFLTMITQALDEAGVPHTDVPLELVYPTEAGHG